MWSRLESGIPIDMTFTSPSSISQSPTPSSTSTLSTSSMPSSSTTVSTLSTPTASSTSSTSGTFVTSTTSVSSISSSTSSISTDDSSSERRRLHLRPASSVPLLETWDVRNDSQPVSLVLQILTMFWAMIVGSFSAVKEWWWRDRTKIATRVQGLTLELARVKEEEQYWKGKARELWRKEQKLFNLARDLDFDVMVLTEENENLEDDNQVLSSEHAMLDDELQAARYHIRSLGDKVDRLTDENRYSAQAAEVLRYQSELLENSFEIVRRQRDDVVHR